MGLGVLPKFPINFRPACLSCRHINVCSLTANWNSTLNSNCYNVDQNIPPNTNRGESIIGYCTPQESIPSLKYMHGFAIVLCVVIVLRRIKFR